MDGEMDMEAFRTRSLAVGLELTAEQAAEALAGANRWRRNVEQLRTLVTRDMEPALVFHAPTEEHPA